MPTRTQQADLIGAAYASHGDTKHPMLLPMDPGECFTFAAQAFDLADRLQTTVFVMLDLDMGMNEWLTEPFKWDDSRRMDRGKVMMHDELEAGRDFGRYLDVDGDGIPYRTYPGVHPTRGGYFTRGTSRNPYARYSEEGSVYVDNVQRLLRKFETAKSFVPAPELRPASAPTREGVIYYGSTGPAMHEALGLFERQGRRLDALRIRAFPFSSEVDDFLASHDRIFVVEQNRDAQLRTLLMAENGGDPDRLVPILHFDGTPITARFIVSSISSLMDATQPPGSRPLREAAE
jgi:2-oxoglutarate ferredoxin oxidoreductase subunit alpha